MELAMKTFIRTILVMVVCLISLSTSVQAQTTYEVPVGGIAIIGFDFDNDYFAFVCLVPIPLGTDVLFTDNGWSSGLDNFRTGEGINLWSPDTECKLGDVILTSSGELDQYLGTFMNLSTSGDQIFIYQKRTDGTPRLIFGLNSDGENWLPNGSYPTVNQSNLPNQLAILTPSPAITLVESDYGYYQGPRGFDSTTDALAAITNFSNWKTSDSLLNIPTTPFTFTTTAVHLSDMSAETGSESPPWWVLLGLVIVPVLVMVFKRPKKDCCK
jgi:hypothetical protein